MAIINGLKAENERLRKEVEASRRAHAAASSALSRCLSHIAELEAEVERLGAGIKGIFAAIHKATPNHGPIHPNPVRLAMLLLLFKCQDCVKPDGAGGA